MIRVMVISTSRADYGILRPILRGLSTSACLDPQLVLCGDTVQPGGDRLREEIRQDGFTAAAEATFEMACDSPAGIARSMGRAVQAMADVVEALQPNLVFVTGDRFEMFAAAAAVVPFAVPLAHLHGGELTEGAIDNVFRQSITKMSHVHFVSTHDAGRRIAQLGEPPDRILVVGAPSLDNLRNLPVLDRSSLENLLDLPLDPAPLLVTLHPETLRFEDTDHQVEQLRSALVDLGCPVIFTGPNADTHGERIRRAWIAARELNGRFRYLPHLGQTAYFSLFRFAAAMVGNSSSGILEAPSFQLPVVNLGDRQRGRVQAANVINAPFEASAIVAAIRRAVDPGFRAQLRGQPNPYGDGHATARIVAGLENLPPRDALLRKPFVDWPPPAGIAPCLVT